MYYPYYSGYNPNSMLDYSKTWFRKNKPVIKPPLLNKGDTIGLVTLGSPMISTEAAKKNIEFLENMGYRTLTGTYFWNTIFASPPLERASDFMNMILNPEVKMILPLKGGTGTADILGLIDYQAIQANPKIITGYSDLAILLNTIFQQTGLITFNGLLLIDFKPETPPFNFDHFFQSISTTTAPYAIENPPEMPLVSKVPGVVEGQIVGGNVSSIMGSLGTPNEIDTKGKILFLEDINESVARIYRFLTHFKRAGKLDDCIGIIWGECTSCTPDYNISADQIIEQVLSSFGKPFIMGLATSHGKYKVTIPIGSRVRLDATNATITVLEPAVS